MKRKQILLVALQHFSDTKFNSDEYVEYPNNEERDRKILAQLYQIEHSKDTYLRANQLANKEESTTTQTLDKSMYSLICVEKKSNIARVS